MTVSEDAPAPARVEPRAAGRASAVALFFLSPLVGEFLFGNVSIGAIWFVLIVAPMYGGGALLIREAVRRSGRGWPSIFLLGLAYAMIEEGLVTQLLFNPSYSTYGVEVTGPTYIPFLGINAVMTVSVVTLHTVWSICVPIAIVEALAPRRSDSPWLGNLGLTVTAVLFCCGSAYVTYGVYQEEDFLAAAPQLAGAAVTSALLIAVALRLPIRRAGRVRETAPRPWLVGLTALLVTGGLMFLNVWTFGRSFMHEGPVWGWASVAAWFALAAAAFAVVARWSRRRDWGARHRLALAGGATLTYALVAFPQDPILGSPGIIDLLGNVILFAGAALLITAAGFALRREDREDAARQSAPGEARDAGGGPP